MASPVVVEAIESSTNTAGTSHVVTLPTATEGQLLLIILNKGSTAATINSHASLTELLDENLANGLYVAYRWMDGTEPASYTLTSSANTRTARIAYRISGAANPATSPPEIGTTGTGTSATPDPPASATPSSSKDYLFIAFAGMAGEEADDDTWGNTPPTNYLPNPPRQKSCGTAGTNLGGLILSAERALTTGSAENPGTFGVDVSAAWRSQTIMVHPDLTQALTQSSTFTNTASFFAAVVAAGSVALTPTLYTNDNAFYAPTVTQPAGGQDLTQDSRFDNTGSFYGPTLSATYSITPARYDNAQTIYAATVAAGSFDLTPAIYTNSQSFYSPTVTTGAVGVDATLYTNDQAFYAPTVSQSDGSQILSPDLFVNTGQFYAPAVLSESTAVETPGGGKSKSRKTNRKTYIERDGKILVFANQRQAESYLKAEAEAEAEGSQVFADGYKPKKKRINPQVIEVDALKAAIPQEVKRINYLFEIKNFDELFWIQAAVLSGKVGQYLKMIEDENDIEVLLLSI